MIAPPEDAAVIAPPAEDPPAPPAEDPPAPATDVIAHPAEDTAVIAAPASEDHPDPASEDHPDPASEDHPAPAPASVPVIDAVPAAPNATNINCMNEPTLFSSTDPACHVPEKTPDLHKLITKVAEAVVEAPVNYVVENGTDLAVEALKATGNKAIVAAAMGTMTPEQAELLDKVSDDPQVEAALKKVEANAIAGINQSIEKATEVVLPQLQEAAADITKGVLTSAVTAVSDFPPVGAVISAVTAAGTAIDAAKNAIEIVPDITDALQPIQDAVAEFGDVTDAVNGAVERAQNAIQTESSHAEAENENEHAHGAPGQEFELQPMGASAATANESASESVNASESVKPPRFVEATPHKPDPNQPFARKQTKTEEEQDNAGLGGGGSRKRRRIHKLSRRIERTLRRVQKKYGLQDDKNSFLRRTLRKGTYVPPQTPHKGHNGL